MGGGLSYRPPPHSRRLRQTARETRVPQHLEPEGQSRSSVSALLGDRPAFARGVSDPERCMSQEAVTEGHKEAGPFARMSAECPGRESCPRGTDSAPWCPKTTARRLYATSILNQASKGCPPVSTGGPGPGPQEDPRSELGQAPRDRKRDRALRGLLLPPLLECHASFVVFR